MSAHAAHTALITGANAGLGFEAAAQLADAGYARVVLACRTLEKAADAKARLVERTGKDVFDVLAADVGELKSSEAAANELIGRDYNLDLVVLNAGLACQTLTRTSDGNELTLAASLFGHHVLTMRLLEAGKLSANVRIVIAGSEGARGEMPGMGGLLDYGALESTVGDLDGAMDAVAKGDQPTDYHQMRTYGNAKVWVAWWASALARQLPDGMVVVSVSPGGNAGTSFGRHLPAPMRMMMPLAGIFLRWFGMDGPVADGAKRYVDAGEFPADATGKFWASPPGKLVGPLEPQSQPHFADVRLQDAAWRSVVRLTGAGLNVPATA